MTLLTPATTHVYSPAERPLTPEEARVLGTLMEKARTVPDSYPMTLNTVVTGCNQKTSRAPLLNLSDAQVQEALSSLKSLTLVFETSGSRATRYEHNAQRGIGVPEQSAALLGLLMLRGPQTAGELRLNAERWHRFADIPRSRDSWMNCRPALTPRAARWSPCCPRRPAPASRVGRTCCVARWMPASYMPAMKAAVPAAASWKHA